MKAGTYYQRRRRAAQKREAACITRGGFNSGLKAGLRRRVRDGEITQDEAIRAFERFKK